VKRGSECSKDRQVEWRSAFPNGSTVERRINRDESTRRSGFHLVHALHTLAFRPGEGGRCFPIKCWKSETRGQAETITKLNKAAVFVVDALDGCQRGFEVERSSLPQRDSSERCLLLVAFGNHGFGLTGWGFRNGSLLIYG
jgi:hypothetical protein